jgi:uncharacterized iron-regulated membrane protein
MHRDTLKLIREGLPLNIAATTPSSKSSKLSLLKARRKIWLEVHLWLGLFAGAVLCIIGLTGSVLVFHQEIGELLNPHMRVVQALPEGEKSFRSMREILEAAREVMPANAQLDFGYYPRNNETAYHLFFSVSSESESNETWHVFVNPYTAKVTGKLLVLAANSTVPVAFIPFVFQLHYGLLLNWETGSLIVGLTGVVLIFSVLTGLIVWWPLTGKWRQALTIKRRASVERFNNDLHKTFGFYTAMVLLALLVSGIYFNLREEFHTLVGVFSPATDRYALHSSSDEGRNPISLAEAAAIVNARYPEGRMDWLYGAPAPDSTYTICKHNLDSLSRFVGRRCVVIDQYSGDVLFEQVPNKGTAGDYFILWQWPIHSGQVFGMAGRILVFLTGFACPVLYITGVLRWFHKQRAAQRVNRLSKKRSRGI